MQGIVFSQFVSMLDLVEHRLKRAGIKAVKLDGRMTFDARDKYISSFCDDDQTRVFLISLKAGGVALNLTVASAVFIMDPWSVPLPQRHPCHSSLVNMRFHRVRWQGLIFLCILLNDCGGREIGSCHDTAVKLGFGVFASFH